MILLLQRNLILYKTSDTKNAKEIFGKSKIKKEEGLYTSPPSTPSNE